MGLAGAAPATRANSIALPNPVMFAGQVPLPGDFASVASTFGNHQGNQRDAPRGGDLFIVERRP